MKPIELEMQAFGTFAQKTIIDFTKFNDKVFLVYGKTGSGKTTIFDAICYALYGEVSGELRNKAVTENVRSTYSDNKTPTYVRYKFKIKDDIYQIERFPGKQPIEKKLTIYKNEKVTLLKNNENISKAKVTETNNFIASEVIKLSREQFKQTMMISQGDFAALIKADSKERTAIFRKILETTKLELIANNLKEQTLAMKNKAQQQKSILNSELASLPRELFLEDYYNDKVIASANFTFCSEILTFVQTKINELTLCKEKLGKTKDTENKHLDAAKTELANQSNNNNLVNNYQLQLKKLDLIIAEEANIKTFKMAIENHDKAVELANKVKLYHQSKKSYETSLATIKENERELAELKKTYPSINNNYAKIDGLEKENLILNDEKKENEQQLANFIKLKKAKAEEISLIAEVKKAESLLTLAKNDLEKGMKKYEEANSFILDNSSVEADLKQNEHQIKEIKDSLKQLESISNTMAKLTEANKSLVNEKNKLQELKVKALNLEADYHIQEGYFLKSQAAVLANDLKPSMPCPVCGSLEHPHLATFTEKQIAKSDVENAKKLYEGAKGLVTEKQSQINVLETKIEKTLEAINESLESNFKVCLTYQEILPFLIQEELNLKESLTTLEANSKVLDLKYRQFLSNKELVADRSELTKLENKEAVAKTSLEGLNAKLSSKKGELLQLEASVVGYSEANILKRNEEITILLKENNQKISTYRIAMEDYVKKETAFNSVIKQATNDCNRNEKELEQIGAELELVETKLAMTRFDYEKFLLPNDKVKLYKEKISEFETNLTSTKALIAEAQKNNVDKMELIDTKLIQEKIDTLSLKIKNIENIIMETAELIAITNKQVARIKNVYADYQAIETEYGPYNELSEVFNGEVSGKRISFETFYQVQFFKQILQIASQRFSKMTGGKYALVYKEDFDTGSKKTGLDMEVLDNYNGVKRNIGSLSGGESFMASLALALSMSDIIQAKAGGITLDSMFIDEGFGTLDPEALNNAIDQIATLSYNGKTVGLISHVEELKNRIPTQIHVLKRENGSIIE